MDRKIRVLIFPCGAENALEIFNALRNVVNIEIFGASAKSDHGEFVFRNYIGSIPNIYSDDFLSAFSELVLLFGIDVVIPTHDDVVLKLAQLEDAIGVKLLVHGLKQAEICRSKRKTFSFFRDEDFCCKTYSSISDVSEFPVFLKPDSGQGGKGTFLLEHRHAVNSLDTVWDHYVICEFLPGEEITVDCFTNYKGELKFAGPRLRARVANGISARSLEVELTKDVWSIAERISTKLQLNGLWYFQLKKNRDGKFILLEVSLRVSGTMCLFRGKGINFPLLAIYNAFQYNIEILANKFTLEVDRALVNRYKHNIIFDHVYIDFDDTITRKGLVNPEVLFVIYNLINQNKQIHLITRHEHDIHNTLDYLRIHHGIFKSIISVPVSDSKSKYISHPENAIFIDNSFAERQQVFKELNIPVFDVDALEILIDWRN